MYTSGLQACRGVVCGFIIRDVQIQKYPTIRYVTRNCGGLVGVTQIHHESKKTRHQTLSHNFTYYYPIFKIFFTSGLGSKFATNSCLNIPPRFKHVATLPCEI